MPHVGTRRIFIVVDNDLMAWFYCTKHLLDRIDADLAETCRQFQLLIPVELLPAKEEDFIRGQCMGEFNECFPGERLGEVEPVDDGPERSRTTSTTGPGSFSSVAMTRTSLLEAAFSGEV